MNIDGYVFTVVIDLRQRQREREREKRRIVRAVTRARIMRGESGG